MTNLQRLILIGLSQSTWADAEVYFSNAFGLHSTIKSQDKEGLKREQKKAFLNLNQNRAKTLNEMEILSPSNLQIKEVLRELGISAEREKK